MGKGAFRGSIHFLRAASSAERPYPQQAPLSGKPTARLGCLTHAYPGRPGIRPKADPAFVRTSAFGPADTRIGIRLPSRLPDKQTPALSGRHAPRVFGRPGHRRPTLIRQHPARPRANPRPRPPRWTGPPPPSPDTPTTRTAASAAYTRRRVRTGTAVSGAGHAKNPLRRTPHEGPGCPKKGGNRAYIFVSICRSNS